MNNAKKTLTVAALAVLTLTACGQAAHPTKVVNGEMWGEPTVNVACFNSDAFLMTENPVGWAQYSRWETMDSVCVTGIPEPDEPIPTTNPPNLGGSAELVAPTLLGLSEEKAKSVVESEGLQWRVVERDGISYPVTQDYSDSRINATIKDGVVADTTVG